MTRKMLRNNVIGVIVVFVTILFVAVFTKYHWQDDRAYVVIKDFSSLVIATGAAYLAYCFQRRQAFLVSLRDLWKEIVDSKCELIQYTYSSSIDAALFARAHRSISKSIDLVRGVYRNVEETDTEVGRYPFEPLHDMRRALDALGCTEVTEAGRELTRARIIQAWNSLRRQFLREFSTPAAPHPITLRDSRDTRRRVTVAG